MLTYELTKTKGKYLYEELYRRIKEDILSGRLSYGERLPSKRALAEHLNISKVTVENAYLQLKAEGYISSKEKLGYFVEHFESYPKQAEPVKREEEKREGGIVCDLISNSADPSVFPFSVWMRLMREVTLDYDKELLSPLPYNGARELREAIAEHLRTFRGMNADPDNIIIGAGTEYLYSLVVQLLGRERVFAVEDPGYDKARLTYGSMGARCIGAELDSEGVSVASLRASGADVLHISPSHHFPTGKVTSPKRRQEFFQWASEFDRYIIEDDYDWEFRLGGKPQPPMFSLDRRGKVIYINTFSKSISPSLRISYMILPDELALKMKERLGFYSCTVPSLEQYTLARFIERGYFEKHINRAKRVYRQRRDSAMEAVRRYFSDSVSILEEDAGLHFILKIPVSVDDGEFVKKARDKGVLIKSITDYSQEAKGGRTGSFIINYSGADPENIEKAMKLLSEIVNIEK